jgi:hypothetical protein
MPTRRLKIRLKGAVNDQEHVRLNELIGQLQTIYVALNRTDHIISKKEHPSVVYRVVDLSHSSPATITLEATPIDPQIDYSDLIVDKFISGLQTITQRSEPPADFDRETLEAYKGITSMLRRHMTEIEISADGVELPITRDLEHKIDHIIGPDILSEGSMTGDLETVNVHNKNTFYIYPVIGPKKVLCNFSPDMFDKVKIALKQYVTVTGVLRYKAREPYPYAIDVKELEMSPPEEQLPTIWDLRGIAPAATGGLDSVAFIRTLRDAKN